MLALRIMGRYSQPASRKNRGRRTLRFPKSTRSSSDRKALGGKLRRCRLPAMSVTYRIQVFKDGENVTANFEVRVMDMASPELLADFRLMVEGTNLTADFQAGQKEYTGTRTSQLKQPEKDAEVTFSVSTNNGWSDSGSDTLRGSQLRDDCLFEN